MTIHLKIRNVRSITSADLDLDGLTLVAGQNGAGKSTIQTCLCALLAGERGFYGKGVDTAAAMVRHGEKEARAIISVGSGRRMAKWSRSGAVREEHAEEGITGSGPTASLIALGRETFAAMKLAERAALLARVCKTEPTQNDLRAAISEAEIDANAGKIWDKIEIDGWDIAAKAQATFAAGCKSRWQEVTGNPRWGSKIGETWGDDIEGDEAQLQARADELAAQIAEATKAVPMSDEERAEAEAEADAAKLEENEARLADLNAKNRVMIARHEEIEDEKAKLPKMSRGLECPRCGELLAMAGEELVKLDADQERAAAARLKELNAEASKLLEDGKPIIAGIREAEDLIKAARNARDRLARANGEPVDKGVLDQMKTERADVESLLKKIRSKPRAAELHKQITTALKLAEILGPEGLRKRRLEGTLDAINSRIGYSADAMGLQSVRIDMDMNVSRGSDRYEALSESEKWRVDLAIQIELAKLDKSCVVCVDRLDVIQADGPSRGPVLKLLSTLSIDIPVVVLMTAGEKAGALKTPDLAKMGMGKTMLLVGGHLATMDGEVEQRRAA